MRFGACQKEMLKSVMNTNKKYIKDDDWKLL